MSKPHVWVVEYRNEPWPWELWSYHKTQEVADQACGFLSKAYKRGQFRVAKYVRVEPTAKPRKIRKTTIKLGPAEFIENDCATSYSWTQPTAKRRKGK